MTFSAYDYGHILAALNIGLKGAEDSCNVTDSERGQIEYAIKLVLNLHDTVIAPKPDAWMADQVRQYGSD